MRFLVDEDLSKGVAGVFSNLGFETQRVTQVNELHGKPDEVIFEYAQNAEMVIVTADVGFASLERFPLYKLPAMILLRFSNEMADSAVSEDLRRQLSPLGEQDIRGHLIVIEPGVMRVRSSLQF